ncbi:MAG: UbiD family decarboxylase [Bacteroidota bacterium]
MRYRSLQHCVKDLEKNGHLVRVQAEIDPYLEIAEIQRRAYQAGAPAILFENVKGSRFPALTNLFGTMERTNFIFRSTIKQVKKIVQAKADPTAILKAPHKYLATPFAAVKALPLKSRFGAPILHGKTSVSALPQVHSWPMDGGPYVTLPQVCTEDPASPGIMKTNVGMYRIQLNGNEYIPDKEIGLHYQIHRGIGVHHTHAAERNERLKVSIFVGGPPAHTFAAVMPLPEGLSELMFAGLFAGRNFRYTRKDGHLLSSDADFCIVGSIDPQATKPEGPFGDHLGYYSLQHEFPVMQVDAVYHRKGAIWPFTVVGRPPQEDTSFGDLIHEVTAEMVPVSVPGLISMNAVDAAGVHPLLLAIGNERYVPYEERSPKEILTVANAVLGFGQASLAKYLMMTAYQDQPDLDIHDISSYFQHLLSRMDFRRDLHFQTRTTIDTLDYSSEGLNEGSKVVFAAAGAPKRTLSTTIPEDLKLPQGFSDPRFAIPGVLMVKSPPHGDAKQGNRSAQQLAQSIPAKYLRDGIAMIVMVDDSEFAAKTLNNFLWVTFTRSNPSHDIYGSESFIEHKHWGCNGPVIIDARVKSHHAPALVENPAVSKRVDELSAQGGPLHGILP